MDLLQAVKERHSVRQYLDKPIEADKANELKAFIDECNREGNLHFQLILNEPKAFGSFMAHYGKFSGVKNYVALVAEKGKTTEEKVGYFGAKIVLLAQIIFTSRFILTHIVPFLHKSYTKKTSPCPVAEQRRGLF